VDYNLIVFDFDGTLYDSHSGIASAFSESAEKIYGTPVKLNRSDVGPKLREIHDSIFISSTQYSSFEKVFRELYDGKYCYSGEFFSGVDDLLLNIKENNIRQGIISNKPQGVLNSILNCHNLQSNFEFIVGSSINSRISKSKMLSNQLSIKNNHTIGQILVIGDTVEDYAMAEENSCDFIYAAYGYGFVDLEKVKYVVKPIDILKILDLDEGC
jgi:phosphoglycolate phosphatase-like HAD superfamily hydrolase